MADCIECGSFTKFNGGLCLSCYHSQKDTANNGDDLNLGLNNKEYAYHYGMIKGRIAETLIQELLHNPIKLPTYPRSS